MHCKHIATHDPTSYLFLQSCTREVVHVAELHIDVEGKVAVTSGRSRDLSFSSKQL